MLLADLKICGHLSALVFISTAVDRRPFDVSGGARTTQAPHRVAANDQIKPKFTNIPNPKIPNTIENTMRQLIDTCMLCDCRNIPAR